MEVDVQSVSGMVSNDQIENCLAVLHCTGGEC